MTTASAAIFMITSFVLSYLASENTSDRLFEDLGTVEQQATGDEALFEDLGTVAPEAGDDTTGVLSTATAATAEPGTGAAAPDAPAAAASDAAAPGEASEPR